MQRRIAAEPPFRPIKVVEVELSEAVPALAPNASRTGDQYGWAHVLVRLHGEPLGVVPIDVSAGGLAPDDLLRRFQHDLGGPIARHLEADGLAGSELGTDGLAGSNGRCRLERTLPADPPMVSVVVATFHRADQLPRCLDALLANDYPNFEVVLVDNSPDDRATRLLIEERYGNERRLRYRSEWRQGTSRARNAGLTHASGELVAFTDDDVIVDRQWVRSMADALLSDTGVTCATGLTRPYELETPAQAWFEQYGGFDRGYERQVFELSMEPPPTLMYPYTAGVVGASNNMAISRTVALELGGFDERLGPGTRAVGGEDLDLFVRVLLAGHRIVYEPRGLVHHAHRADDHAILAQTFGYGVGATAMLTKWLLTAPDMRRKLLRTLISSAPTALGPRHGSVSATSSAPRRMAAAQLAGNLWGPVGWLRSNRQHRLPDAGADWRDPVGDDTTRVGATHAPVRPVGTAT